MARPLNGDRAPNLRHEQSHFNELTLNASQISGLKTELGPITLPNRFLPVSKKPDKHRLKRMYFTCSRAPWLACESAVPQDTINGVHNESGPLSVGFEQPPSSIVELIAMLESRSIVSALALRTLAIVFLALSLPGAAAIGNDLVLVEAESADDIGGWVVDQQFMDLMGSPYLLAHGLGEPVPDAVTHAEFPAPGAYRV